MIKRLNVFNITEKDQLQLDLTSWILDSHYWIEYYPGYFECKWCKEKHTSTKPVTVDYELCKKNPVIERFFSNLLSGFHFKQLLNKKIT